MESPKRRLKRVLQDDEGVLKKGEYEAEERR